MTSSPIGSGAADALSRLAALPGVEDAVAQAREACTRLRWHNALRRRQAEAAAESRVRGARASALIEGADVRVRTVRELVLGLAQWPDPSDPVMDTLRAAVQVTAASEQVRQVSATAPGQALARLHVAAGQPLLTADQLGRPRLPGEDSRELMELGPAPTAERARARMTAIQPVLAAGGDAPALVVAAVAHAEVAWNRPFLRGNGMVARALERAVVQRTGLDPTGAVVPEVGHHREGVTGYAGALAAYGSGSPEGVALWLRWCAGSITAGAVEGERIADAVLAGRTG